MLVFLVFGFLVVFFGSLCFFCFLFLIKPYILCVVGLLTLHLSQELHVFKRKNDIPMPGVSRSVSFGTWKNIDPSLGPWALRDGFKRFRRYSTLTHSFRVAFACGHFAFAGGSPTWARILNPFMEDDNAAQIVVVYNGITFLQPTTYSQFCANRCFEWNRCQSLLNFVGH